MSSNQSDNVAVIELINEKRELEGRIADIVSQLGRMPNVNSLAIEAAEWNTRLESFIRLNGGSEANIAESRKDDFLEIKRKAEQTASVAKKVGEKQASLAGELAELKEKLENFQFRAGAKEVRNCRNKAAELERRVDELNALITQEEAKVAQAREDNPHFAKMIREREDLLADVAAGVEIDKAKFEKLEARIAEEEKKKKELGKAVFVAVQTIAGLRRKFEQASMELRTARENCRAVVSQFLKTEAQLAGEEYAQLARQLSEKFMQIMSLSEMLQNRNAGINIFGAYCADFQIPAFNLEACRSVACKSNPGLIFRYETADKTLALDVETKRIKALGVELD